MALSEKNILIKKNIYIYNNNNSNIYIYIQNIYVYKKYTYNELTQCLILLEIDLSRFNVDIILRTLVYQ